MKLVADKVLEESPIVANCRMNRERNLSGSNGYDVELRFQASLSNWQAETSFDLISCIHGLHYVGDKLGLIARTGIWLTDHGRFTANLDMANIRLSNGQSSSRIVASELREAGFDYSFRDKLIQCDGRHEAHLPFRYLGADDQAGPNYTGQPAVDSYYERLHGQT